MAFVTILRAIDLGRNDSASGYVARLAPQTMTMAQHFLLSAASRTLSLKAIYKAGEDAAYETFKPSTLAGHERRAGLPALRLRSGLHDHIAASLQVPRLPSPVLGHVWHDLRQPKLAFTDLLTAISLLVNGAKDLSAVQLSRDLDAQYKTAFVLAHKLRETMAASQCRDTLLDGKVEMDGTYFGGHIRPENRKEDRIDRRLKRHQSPHPPCRRRFPRASWSNAALRHQERSRGRRSGQAPRRTLGQDGRRRSLVLGSATRWLAG